MSKFYVVWEGKTPGIYHTWREAEAQIKGVKGALFKAFKTLNEAQTAFSSPAHHYVSTVAERTEKAKATRERNKNGGLPPTPPDYRHDTVLPLPPQVSAEAWAVDAACSGNPGKMEYRGVCLQTGAVIFHFGPLLGTNNIGEFLAIVHALALMEKHGIRRTIYSDSVNAISWVKAKTCRTKLIKNAKTAPIYDYIQRAETWLRTHDFRVPIEKWETKQWGEIPADFGRK